MNITTALLIQCSYFFLFVFAVIVFFDVLIRFKSQIQLKAYFLAIIIGVGISSFCSFIMSGPDQYILTIILCKVIVATSLIQIFTNIYFVKYRVIANVYTLITAVFFLFLAIYVYGFKNEATLVLKTNTITSALDQREFDLILPIYLKLFVYLFFIGFNAFSLYYSYCILFIFSYKNIYFKRVQLWTFAFITLVILALLSAFLKIFLHIPNSSSILVSIISMGYLLLIILYRPGFINKNGSRISFGLLFNRNDFTTDIKETDFNFHFYNHLYYKSKTANIIEFSTIMGVSKEVMFNYIYFTYSMSFDELLNKARVEYFVEIIKEPQYKNYTVEALALEVGFSSRQRFYQPFKKYHGGNPSDLIDILND
jgi:AraC-like DNA-binding protein